MSMTQQQFDKWFDTNDGQTSFFEWMYENHPEMHKDQMIDAMESGDYIESFMEDLGVEYEES